MTDKITEQPPRNSIGIADLIKIAAKGGYELEVNIKPKDKEDDHDG